MLVNPAGMVSYILPDILKKKVWSPLQIFSLNGFPTCIGVVNGTPNIQIRKPKENSTSFINGKGYHSLNVQACVDYNYCFFDIVIKWPGSVHDARLFENSGINTKLREGIIPLCKKTIVDGEQAVSICILGDPAYPLLI